MGKRDSGTNFSQRTGESNQMAPPSKKRVHSSVKKESSKKKKSIKDIVPTENQGQESTDQVSKKQASTSADAPTRKLFDHRFVKQDSFFSRASKLKLETVSSIAHTFVEPDTLDEAFAIPPEDTSKFRIMRMDYTVTPLLFRCPARSSSEWRSWVQSELENQGVRDQLDRAGIFSALVSSTQIGIFRDIRGLRHIVRRWNKTTHTFVCAWGEFTPTLDDVYMLLRLPIMGDESPFSIELSEEEAKVESLLVEGMSLCRQVNKRQSSRPSFACWIRYFWGTREKEKFYPGGGYDKGCRLEALICLWLSKFVFPELSGDVIQRRLFRLAIKIAQAVRFPLAPIFLGTFYKHLDMIVEDEVLAAGRYVIDSELAINFLQVFLWERIRKYAGQPASSKSVAFELGMNSELPLWSRWFHMKQTQPSICFFLDDIDNFIFRPYVGLATAFASSLFHNVSSSASDIVEVPIFDSDNGTWSDLEYVVSIRPGLLPAWVGNDVFGVNYWPHRVLRQFGIDQGVPRSYSFTEGDLHDSPSFGLPRFICSSLKSLPSLKSLKIQMAGSEREGLYTPKFVAYWKKMINDFTQFIKSPPLICRALPPNSVPKRLKLDTREVLSFCSKIGMPFTIIDGTQREIIATSKHGKEAVDQEENPSSVEPLFENSPIEEDNDPFPDQQTLSNIPVKKRTLLKPTTKTPKRRSTRIKDKRLPTKIAVTDEEVVINDENIPEGSKTEVRDNALGESEDDVSDKPQSEEEDDKLRFEDDDNELESEQRTSGSRDQKGSPRTSQDDGRSGLENESKSTKDNQQDTNNKLPISNVAPELVMVPRVDESQVLPFKTPSPIAKRPRELLSGDDEDIKNAKRLDSEVALALLGDSNEVASETAKATTLESAPAEICWHSKLNQFLGAFYGNAVAPHSVEEFVKLSGQTKILNGIAIPEESFQCMNEAIQKHGDFATDCWASKPVRDIMFSRLSLVFFSLMRVPLSELSEDMLLAMRDVVREAIAVGFGVEFLLDHLRKLASALFGRQIYFDKLTAIDSQIENAEKELDEAKAKLEELRQSRSKVVSRASVSTGTEADCIHQALVFCSSLVYDL
ncbi:uncharacterized protein LOC112090317 [Morus notabilis]|uniref:uncharacterized protein LOC112090317 n=1 Tax=Morus notabilis TaxID=981085 RepID=UPI000CED76F1|nr:uncharacterized protein LOC112090317 [Morus notabilis]